jgi:hypothetical protein
MNFLEHWISTQHEQQLAAYCLWVGRRKTEGSSNFEQNGLAASSNQKTRINQRFPKVSFITAFQVWRRNESDY